jgi:uncharacterized protein YndB with AHSA1/START domain
MRIAACDRTMAAPVDVVWRLLTTVVGLNRWMSVEAEVDLRVGGAIRWRHEEGHTVSGEIREVVPMRRLVFTYGWQDLWLPVPAGSTTVTIELEARGDVTEVRVRHDGLTDEMADQHEHGWGLFIGRLVHCAEQEVAR